MFFEVPASRGVPNSPAFPMPPGWAMPPSEAGVVVPLNRLVARGPNTVLALPAARVYSTGCTLELEATMRQGDLSADAWWDLHMSAHLGFFAVAGLENLDRLPHRLLRVGLRFSDGTKVTSLEPGRWQPGGTEPDGPVLALTPGGGGGRGLADRHAELGLWLWPLPPAGPVEFAVEWPIAGIPETIVRLDGAALVAAGGRSEPTWPAA
jgi:hypothetical protein